MQQFFKRQLERSRNRIDQEIKRLQRMVNFGNDADEDEETSESEQFGNQAAIAQTLKGRLADIDSALRKAAKNQYGICEKCKGEISVNLLKVDPESKLCQRCKKIESRK